MTHTQQISPESKIEKSFGDQHRDSDGGKLIKLKMYNKHKIAEKILKRKLINKGIRISTTVVPDNWPVSDEIQQEINWLVNNKMALID